MEVVKVLGSERCYLMSDGSKIPFEEKHKIFGRNGIILRPTNIYSIPPKIEVVKPNIEVDKPKRKRRK